MRLIDGNAIAQQVLAEVKERVAKLAPVVPHVAFVRVGDDPASVSYVTKKQKTAAEVGVSRHRLRVMEGKGLIVESGRRPGGRGLPAVEFSLPNGRKPGGTSGSRKRR